MKKHLICIAMSLALCLTFSLIPTARAAGGSNTITVADDGDLRQALVSAKDGDTIQLAGSATINDLGGKDAPWVIDKAVIIQGGSLNLRAGGVILDKDVTFRNITLGFSSSTRNAIMANGHTLTLENVKCSGSGRPVNLFCGGLYDPDGFGSSPGTEGKIILRGNVSLKGDGKSTVGIYAGNLCMGVMNDEDPDKDGPANVFAGNAEISIEADSGDLGPVYACGAQQRNRRDGESGKVILADPNRYTVSGSVTMRLWEGLVRQADGSGAAAAYVVYSGGANVTDHLVLSNLSGLAVETGYLVPADGSSLREQAAVSVREGARLGLDYFGDLTIGSFTGGGALRLGQYQTLTITGEAAASTRVAIGGFAFDGGSSVRPLEGHT